MTTSKLAIGAAVLLLAVTAGCAQEAPAARVLYVTHWASNDIAALRIKADGSLGTSIGLSPVPGGALNPQGSVRSHDNTWLYVVNWGSANVTTYKIGRGGTLGSPFSTAAAAPAPVTPSGIALGAAGRDIYTANFSNGAAGTISHFTVSTDGRPQAVSTIPAHGSGTTAAAVTPDGHALLAANSTTGDVSSFSIDRRGELSWVATLPTGRGAFFAAITPDSRRALITNSEADSLTLLNIAPDARLTAVSTIANPAREPRGMVLNKNGTRAYVANFDNGTRPGSLTTYQIRADTVTALGRPRNTGSNGAEGIFLSTDEKTLYSANFNTNGAGSVTSTPVDQDGALGDPRAPVPTGGRQPDLGSITAGAA